MATQTPKEIAAGLNRFQRKIICRTKDDFRPSPDVNGRSAPASSMRPLRDRLGLVEDGFGLWRRTDLGRQVAAELGAGR